jgi:phage host-nuclease inhibitor protein Gam
MVRDISEAIADLKRDIERWKSEMAGVQAAGQRELAAQIRRWIAEGEKIIADAGY